MNSGDEAIIETARTAQENNPSFPGISGEDGRERVSNGMRSLSTLRREGGVSQILRNEKSLN